MQGSAGRVQPDVVGDFLIVDLPQARQAVEVGGEGTKAEDLLYAG
jgi:hypothetical protein